MFKARFSIGFCLILAAGAVQAEAAEQAWVARYDGPGHGKDNAQALTVDAGGNAYVTGFSDGGDGNYDFATVKYDDSGNQEWVARYDGEVRGADWVRDVAVGAEGGVYVTGSSAGEGTGFDFATVKYDADGNQLWVSRYDGPAHGDDRVKALTVDASGNAYVTGDSAGPGGRTESVTIKYGPDGDLLWVARSGPSGVGQSLAAVAVDADGNVYVAGSALPRPGNTDFVTIKYDPAGEPLWTAYRDWSAHDDARYLAIDVEGSVYLAGDFVSRAENSDKAAHQDIGVVKYGPDGQELWSISLNGGDGTNEVASALRLGQDGSIYVTGTILPPAGDGVSPPAAEYVTVRYEANGGPLWTVRHRGFDQAVSMAQGLALDSDGNAYVLTSDRGMPDRKPVLTLIRYGVEGEELWTVGQAGLATTITSGVSVGAPGGVWIAGSDASGRDYLVAKYVETEASATPSIPPKTLTPAGVP
jgi:hypothetical protein